MDDDRTTPKGDGVTPQARLAMWASAAGLGVEGFDLLLLVFLLAPIAASFDLTTIRAATLMGGRFRTERECGTGVRATYMAWLRQGHTAAVN